MSYISRFYQDSRKPKLLDQVRLAIRTRHYSIRTEEAYVQWIRRFILFHTRLWPIMLPTGRYGSRAREPLEDIA